MQAIVAPLEPGLAAELALDAGDDDRVPKPSFAGFLTCGRPILQCSTRVLGELPAHLELARDRRQRAPYFTALVASSCSASVSVWAEAGWSDTAGPAAMMQSPRSLR